MRKFIASVVFLGFLAVTLGLSSGCGKEDTSGGPSLKNPNDPSLKNIKKVTPSAGGGDGGGGKPKPVSD